VTENARSRIADIKVLSLVVGIVAAMATCGWGIAVWATGRVSKEDLHSETRILHKRIGDVDDKAEAADGHATQIEQTIGRDVRTIKCLLTAPNRRAKERCGLE